MKPKITCRSCSAELEWGVQKCTSCGTAVEWPSAGTAKAAPTAAQPSSFPVRNIIAVIAFIGLGVVALEYFSGPQAPPPAASGQAGAAVNESGADMSALPHIEDLEKQLQGDPGNQTVRRELGNHLMDARFYHRAITVYRDYLERDPKDPDIRVDMAICYKELGDLETAEKEMRTALTNAPRHLYAHFNLGIVKLVQGNVDEAASWFRKTAELDPNGQLGQRAQQLIDQHLSVSVQ